MQEQREFEMPELIYGLFWIIVFNNFAFTTLIFVTLRSLLREPNSYVNFLSAMKLYNYRWTLHLSWNKWQPLGGPLSKQYWHNLCSVYALNFKPVLSEGTEAYYHDVIGKPGL